jgi:16S rRNA (cytidine1402-2'-O)-methyltransferase
MRVINEHTQDHQILATVKEIQLGKSACFLSDGGCPVISDPGGRFCDLANQQNVPIDAVPGPSAVTTALMLSGFFAQRFAFLGFLGRKPGAIKGELEPYADSAFTLVLFESPHRIDAMLRICGEVLGDRRYVICRELTKSHQQIYRNRFPTYPLESEIPKKGEVTIVIEGRRRNQIDG